jgi:hypothetical protein
MKYQLVLFCMALLTIFSLLSSCKNKKDKENKENITIAPPAAADILSGKIADNELSAKWISATLKINANDGSRSQNFAADMRWQKNEAIWLSIYPNFGIKIEVARALVTPDSVRVLDRFNRKYYAYPISYLQTQTGYPIDFNTLQRIMSGSRILASESPCQTDTLANEYVLKTTQNTLSETLHISRSNYTATQLLLDDKTTQQSIKIDMAAYKPIDSKMFAHSRKIIIRSSKGSYQASLDFSELSTHTEPLEMPFSVSGKYK